MCGESFGTRYLNVRRYRYHYIGGVVALAAMLTIWSMPIPRPSPAPGSGSGASGVDDATQIVPPDRRALFVDVPDPLRDEFDSDEFAETDPRRTAFDADVAAMDDRITPAGFNTRADVALTAAGFTRASPSPSLRSPDGGFDDFVPQYCLADMWWPDRVTNEFFRTQVTPAATCDDIPPNLNVDACQSMKPAETKRTISGAVPLAAVVPGGGALYPALRSQSLAPPDAHELSYDLNFARLLARASEPPTALPLSFGDSTFLIDDYYVHWSTPLTAHRELDTRTAPQRTPGGVVTDETRSEWIDTPQRVLDPYVRCVAWKNGRYDVPAFDPLHAVWSQPPVPCSGDSRANDDCVSVANAKGWLDAPEKWAFAGLYHVYVPPALTVLGDPMLVTRYPPPSPAVAPNGGVVVQPTLQLPPPPASKSAAPARTSYRIGWSHARIARCLMGQRVMFSGDSMARQIFSDIPNLARGINNYAELTSHHEAGYVMSLYADLFESPTALVLPNRFESRIVASPKMRTERENMFVSKVGVRPLDAVRRRTDAMQHAVFDSKGFTSIRRIIGFPKSTAVAASRPPPPVTSLLVHPPTTVPRPDNPLFFHSLNAYSALGSNTSDSARALPSVQASIRHASARRVEFGYVWNNDESVISPTKLFDWRPDSVVLCSTYHMERVEFTAFRHYMLDVLLAADEVRAARLRNAMRGWAEALISDKAPQREVVPFEREVDSLMRVPPSFTESGSSSDDWEARHMNDPISEAGDRDGGGGGSGGGAFKQILAHVSHRLHGQARQPSVHVMRDDAPHAATRAWFLRSVSWVNTPLRGVQACANCTVPRNVEMARWLHAMRRVFGVGGATDETNPHADASLFAFPFLSSPASQERSVDWHSEWSRVVDTLTAAGVMTLTEPVLLALAGVAPRTALHYIDFYTLAATRPLMHRRVDGTHWGCIGPNFWRPNRSDEPRKSTDHCSGAVNRAIVMQLLNLACE